jgi:hypothetical protein
VAAVSFATLPIALGASSCPENSLGGASISLPLASGWLVNAKRVYRLYREIGLQLRNKTLKRRVKAKPLDFLLPTKSLNLQIIRQFVTHVAWSASALKSYRPITLNQINTRQRA